MDWLLLIHQIPAKPAYFRAKIWRRLQQLGAVAIKQSVYALPEQGQAREDFTWIVKEIVAGGGEAVLLTARFQEGLDDQQVIALFHEARRADYEKILTEVHALVEQWRSDGAEPEVATSEHRTNLARLRKAFVATAAIDFFSVPEQARAEAALADLETILRRQGTIRPVATGPDGSIPAMTGKTWVTRENLYVDRMACVWLIKRYIDPDGALKFVDSPSHQPDTNEVRFDMAEAEYTHEGNRCSFEVMVERFGLADPALIQVARIIHDIDLKESAFDLPETAGIQALFDGIIATTDNDMERIGRASAVLDNLLAFFKSKGN
jgi:hypothetical protein